MKPSLLDILATGLRDALGYIDTLEGKLNDDTSLHKQFEDAKVQLNAKDQTIFGQAQEIARLSALTAQQAQALDAQTALLNADDAQLQQLTGLTDLITKLQAKVGNASTPITSTTPIVNPVTPTVASSPEPTGDMPALAVPVPVTAPAAATVATSVADPATASGDSVNPVVAPTPGDAVAPPTPLGAV